MSSKAVFLSFALAFPALLSSTACGGGSAPSPPGDSGKTVLRVGHFPNITHAQALVAHAMSRAGKGWFEERLGPGVEIRWFVYNAGPTAMEAFFTQSADLAYVGPNPALNAHIKSGGEEVRIIAGAAVGGAALVVRPGAGIETPSDFRGKRIATPQLGNTQDVACRAWLKEQGFRVTQLGGDAHIVPTANPDQLALFKRGAVDAVWTVEPWVSRLELEAGGKIFLEESGALTTVLVSRAAFLRERPEVVAKFAAAHRELTEWIKTHPDEAMRLVASELRALTTREIPEAILSRAWGRITLTADVSLPPIEDFARAARDAGFLDDIPDLSRFIEARP